MSLINRSEGNVGIADAVPYRFERVMNYEQGMESGLIQFTLQCTNLPPGTKVGFNCATPGPEPLIGIAPTTVTVSPFSVGMRSMVPANFSGRIVYYAEFTVAPPPTAELRLTASWASSE